MSECAKCESAQNVRVRPMWMSPKCQSVPKMSECIRMWLCPKCLCAQCKCAQNVRVRPMWICPKCQSACNVNPHTFFGWLFLCPNFQSAPKVNVPMLAHFLGSYFYTQSFRVIPQCQSAPNMNASKMSECAWCECAQNVRARHDMVHKSSYKPVLLPATWETSTYIYIFTLKTTFPTYLNSLYST